MIDIQFRKDLCHYTRTRQTEFISNQALSFETFTESQLLYETVNKLDQKYSISDSIFFGLQASLTDIENKKGKLGDKYDKEHIETIQTEDLEIVNNFTDILGYASERDIAQDLEGTFGMLKSISRDNDDINYYSNKKTNSYITLYIVFLFLIKGGDIFWCINPTRESVDVVDGGNLKRYIGGGAYIVIGVDEAYYRFHKEEELEKIEGDISKINRTGYALEQVKEEVNIGSNTNLYDLLPEVKPYGVDVMNLKNDYPYRGRKEVKDMFSLRLDRADTSSIEVEIRKNYRLVKPSIQRNNILDEDVTKDIKLYGTIEIKNHVLNNAQVRHVTYSPTYKVWKTGANDV